MTSELPLTTIRWEGKSYWGGGGGKVGAILFYFVFSYPFLSSASFNAPPFRREDLHTFRESLTLPY